MINTNIKEKLDVIETIAEKYNETIYSGVTIKLESQKFLIKK